MSTAALLWAHRGLPLAHLPSKRQGGCCYQFITGKDGGVAGGQDTFAAHCDL